jgi:hypothetical protein
MTLLAYYDMLMVPERVAATSNFIVKANSSAGTSLLNFLKRNSVSL